MAGEYELGIQRENVDFYHIKGVMEELLYFLGYEGRYSLQINDYIPNELHPGVSAAINVNGTNVGIIGKLHPNVSKDSVYVMEINLTRLLSFRTGAMKYKDITKFPGIYKDVAFIVDNNITSQKVEQEIKKAGGKLLTNIQIFDLYPNIEEGKKSMAYKLCFQDASRTLEDEEVMQIFNNIISNVTEKLKAKLRDK